MGSGRACCVVGGAALVAFGLPILILWHLGLLDYSGNQADAKIIATAITLMGGLFASVVTVSVALLRHSIEQRSLALRTEAEQRLRVEAAIRAVSLLGTKDGQDVNPTQRSGALLALFHLQLPVLALDLLGAVFPGPLIPGETVVYLIDLGLRSGEKRAQARSCVLLRRKPDEFLAGTHGFFWPESLLCEWPRDLGAVPTQNACEALLGLLLSRPRLKWGEGYLNAIVATFAAAMRTQSEKWLKAGIARQLHILLADLPENAVVHATTEDLHIGKLKKEVAGLKMSETVPLFEHYEGLLAKWYEDGDWAPADFGRDV